MTDVALPEYFRLKVNRGNSYYPYFRDNSFGGLWIGWNQKDYDRVKTKRENKEKLTSNDRELLHVVDCLESTSHAEKRIFLWDREKQEVSFWRITGKSISAVSIDVVNSAKDSELNKSKNKNETDQIGKDFDKILEGSIIPCEKIVSFPRSMFPAFIDSLSVMFYLNVGTFRALNKVGQQGKREIHLFSGGASGSEFAYLVALYFNWIILKQNGETTESFADYFGILKERLAVMSLVYMSPAQLETFGSLLLMDLGFTLEIGIGKSLADVDLRGSYRHRAENELDQIFSRIVSKLKNVLKVRLSDEFLERLKNEKTVFVQCRDYYNQNQIAGLLYIAHSTHGQIDCINLNTIGETPISELKEEFPLIADWLENSIAFYC